MAVRQRAGRGRRGRPWLSDGGVAVTLVLAPERPENVAIAAAIGAARSLESRLGQAVGIKWPNDLVVAGRKLGGILIERSPQVALLGLGVNVEQTRWPAALQTCAVSLRQLGGSIDRLTVLEGLLPSVDSALQLSDRQLIEAFAHHDVLRGATATFYLGARPLTGIVLEVDPLRGLALQVEGRPQWLPAEQVSTQPPAP